MPKLRFNIASLLGVILVFGIGFAALRESSDLWESGVLTLMIGVLLISILLAVHRTESRRAFWLGFALFGWAYMGLTFMPSVESRLVTTRALHYLDSKLPGRAMVIYSNRGTGSGTGNNQVYSIAVTAGWTQLATSSQGQVRLWNAATGKLLGGWSGTTENFVRIGHSLLAVVSALLGGWLSKYLDTKNPQGTSRPVPAPVPISNDSPV
jgi:hypothetical protein